MSHVLLRLIVLILMAAPVEAAEPEIVIGSAEAPVTVIEYASFTCPHCATFHTGTFPRVRAEYIDTGKVKWVLRHYPLDPLAMAAALMVQCAPADNQFQLASMIFQGQNVWVMSPRPIEPLKQYAQLVGLTGAAVEACLRDTAGFEALRGAQMRAAETHDVQYTPAFFIGDRDIQGAADYPALSAAIDAALAARGSQ